MVIIKSLTWGKGRDTKITSLIAWLRKLKLKNGKTGSLGGLERLSNANIL